ncbi:MAG: ABC transporter substrate-binding protein [Hydrogenophaga sp.]|uniref:ABC transporter substrate-binding protein n=1 Tax=Hydrogenophaga sp. TaxID=1904254 RepID=UPI002ABA1158|nr:ABC transporter substrate-binding protein [Hydrogenophaga sp.]MDZ4187708.1 ABC transporter substrate-binding protein [Hydrogenophaga sp.]
MTSQNNSSVGGVSRRHALSTGLAVAGLSAFPMIGRAQSNTLRVGFVSPRSGPLALFGEGDGFVLDQVRKQLAGGVDVGGKRYNIEFIAKDTQSNPVRAAAMAKELINSDKVDFVLSTSTPETVNPVADACEAAGVPALSTTSPWEAFYFGRGAKPGEPSPFKWAYHFCFGVGNFAKLYADQWSKVPTNKKVGMLLPADADGNAIRRMLIPALQTAGFTVVDAGPYQNGLTDFSAQIALFRKEGIEIFNTFPFPPDFAVFWRQAAQRGLAQQVKIVQTAKAGLFAAELEALGQLGHGVHSGAYWHRSFPFSSPAAGMTSAQLADAYEKTSGKVANVQIGATASLFDAAVATIRSAADPNDRASLAQAMSRLKTETAVGLVDFTTGPVPNCATTGLVGVQWMRGANGKFNVNIVSNADNPRVALTGAMTPYKLG